MIDKVLVLTLRRCPERHWSWLGASKMRDIPTECVEFIPGHDGKDFDSMAEIAEHAATDGFPFVEEYALGTVTEYCQQTTASVSQIWNFARIFRYIAQGEQNCLVLTDDKMLTISFNIVSMIVDELRTLLAPEFLVFQLLQRGDINELEYIERGRFDIAAYSQVVFNAIFKKEISGYAEFFLKPGICGYDESMVLSPEGASWILDCLNNADDFYIFFDHFIKNRLREDAKIAIENGKGIYCPAEHGYAFVDTLMPMKTTTNWAPKDSFHFEESHKGIELPWSDIP